MHIVKQVSKRSRSNRSMNGVLDRNVVKGGGLGEGVRRYPRIDRRINTPSGLGELDGLFNIGKMFTRMFTFTPSSFKFSNIAGAIGSAVTFGATMGASSLLPKVTGAHSALMKDVGYGAMAAAAVVGAVVAAPLVGGALGVGGGAAAAGTEAAVATTAETGGMMAAGTGVLAPAAETSFFAMPSVVSTGSTLMTAGTGVLAPVAESGGILSTIGSGIADVGSTIGSGLSKVMNIFGGGGGMFGGGGGGGMQQQAQQMGPANPTPDQLAAQQAYDAQVAAQQAAMYLPSGYAPSIPNVAAQYTGPVSGGDSTQGDLRSPYTAVTDDGSTVQVDPSTGQPVQPAQSAPSTGFSTTTYVGGASVILLLGYYMMQGEDRQ